MRLSPTTLPLMAVLTLVGAGGGVFLGKGAVGEIDPVHYRASNQSRFYADMVPGGGDRDGEPMRLAAGDPGSNDYGSGGPLLTQATPDYPIAADPVPDPMVAELSRTVTLTETAPAPAAVPLIEAPDPEQARLAAYTSFPITASEGAPPAEAKLVQEPL